jgi:D-alanyl-D-alanine carboxypeptidase/D-alanyl-D-alanine-endopeptidase (penicillin-binding protein 4)
MKKVLILIAGCMLQVASLFAQEVSQQLQKAYQRFEADSQLRHAISSLYVIDAKTGKVVFDKNSHIGLAPASTQKIITSVTAFELLGKDYRYQTKFTYDQDRNNKNNLWLHIIPSGDPTFGSWRWQLTSTENVINRITDSLKKHGVGLFSQISIRPQWDSERTPDGWIWQDIGNYYGAGAEFLNWRENQYDLILKSGPKVGDSVEVVKTIPYLYHLNITSRATAGPKGSGDNAYIYLPSIYSDYYVRGTIPVEESQFKISGAMKNPSTQFLATLKDSLKKRSMWTTNIVDTNSIFVEQSPFYIHYSPSLDSIIYWFNKKSINLYGEALIKTFAYEKQGIGSTDSGVAIVKKFWKEKGLDEDELNIYDGSGLSPLNRVTTHAQVEILKYAKTKDWFPYFLNSLPVYNDMTIKSGTISDVKGFCGYHKAKDGKEYIFSFLVNNYSGRSSSLVNNMYKVLDVLK